MVSKFFQVLIYFDNLVGVIVTFNFSQSVEEINQVLNYFANFTTEDYANFTTEGGATNIGYILERLANLTSDDSYENLIRFEVPDVLILVTDTESSDDVANGAKVLSH